MLPKIISPSELRKNLATFLDLATEQLLIIKDKNSNKVIMDEKEFNRLSALANQFTEEDPEGKYHPKFIKEMLKRSKEGDYDKSVENLSTLV